LCPGLIDYALSTFDGNAFIFQSNNSLDGKVIDNSALVAAGGHQVKGTVHGLNGYRHIDNVLIYTARNPNDHYKKFLNWIGLTNNDIDTGIHCLESYQAVMRCSIRDINSTTRKIVIVPDRRVAEFLEGVFKGSTLIKIPIEIPARVGRVGRPRVHNTARDRKRAQCARDKAKAVKQPPAGNNVSKEICHETPIRMDIVTRCSETAETIWTVNLYDKSHITGGQSYTSAATAVIELDSIDDMVEIFSTAHEIRYERKTDTPCFNFTRFIDPNVDARSAVKAQGTSVLVLDNDGGGMSRAEFSGIFDQEKIIVSNSFSSTSERQKWRVCIPLSRQVTKEEFGRLFAAIMMELENNGFIDHGFDPSKKSIASIYHLPCQADKGDSFFESLVGDERLFMNPDYWLLTVPEFKASPVAPPVLMDGKDWPPEVAEAIEKAVAKFDETGTHAGQGDAAIWALATDLRKLGLPAHEAKPILVEVAKRTTSPADRREQVERISKNWAQQ